MVAAGENLTCSYMTGGWQVLWGQVSGRCGGTVSGRCGGTGVWQVWWEQVAGRCGGNRWLFPKVSRVSGSHTPPIEG